MFYVLGQNILAKMIGALATYTHMIRHEKTNVFIVLPYFLIGFEEIILFSVNNRTMDDVGRKFYDDRM